MPAYREDNSDMMDPKRIVLQYHLSPSQLESILLTEGKNADPDNAAKIEEFYEAMENLIKDSEGDTSYRYVSIHSTEEDELKVQSLCSLIGMNLQKFGIPVEGSCLEKNNTCVKAFKYLICSTNFKTQPLVSDSVSGSLSKDLQPPFSPYLLIKITWYINYESILSEAVLHFPVDLCTEIMEIIPRCVALLSFERAIHFYTIFVQNAYKRLMSMTEVGTQTKDIHTSIKNFAGNLQELIIQLNNERFLECESKSRKSNEKRGILFKKTLRLVKYCLTIRKEKVGVSHSMQEMYKLEFGNESVKKIDDNMLQPFIAEIDNVLVSSLLSKVKEIDCNMYMDWIEYEDYEDTSLSLQRAIGLESYNFVKGNSEMDHSHIRSYNHLTECLKQISCQPTSENTEENQQLVDLINETRKGNKNSLMTLFRRYKEWKNDVKNVLNKSMSILDKEAIAELFEYFATELDRPREKLDFSRLELFSLFLAKSLSHLTSADMMDITINFLVKHKDDENLEILTDIVNFKEFIIHNPNFSKTEDLKVVLFFLCFKPRSTLEILIKMAIRHSDYAGSSVDLNDMKLLLPIMELRVNSRYRMMMESLKLQSLEKETSNFFSVRSRSKRYVVHTASKCQKANQDREEIYCGVPLAAQVIQSIIIQDSHQNFEELACFLDTLFPVNTVLEILNEVSTLFLITQACSSKYLAHVFNQLKQLPVESYSLISMDFIRALEWNAVCILKNNHLSKLIANEILSSIIAWAEKLLNIKSTDTFDSIDSNYQDVLISFSSLHVDNTVHLHDKINRLESLLQSQVPTFIAYSISNQIEEDILRFLLIKCTKKQYCEYLDEMIRTKDQIFKCTTKIDVCDKMSYLTFEACLLCLEFPRISPPHTITFLIQCLTHSLPLISVSKRKQKFCAGLCTILYKNFKILEPSIKCTSLFDAYTESMNQLKEHASDFQTYMNALNNFAHKCMQESDNLKVFKGLHSSHSLRLLQRYNLMVDLMDDKEISYEYVESLN